MNQNCSLFAENSSCMLSQFEYLGNLAKEANCKAAISEYDVMYQGHQTASFSKYLFGGG